MGRHAAPAEFDAPSRPEGVRSAHPITSPLLLDPSRTAAPVPRLEVAPVARRPYVPHASTPVVAEHHLTQHPRAVAPVIPAVPRAAVQRRSTLEFSDGRATVTPRLVAAALTTAPIPVRWATGPVTVAFATPPDEVPRSLGRRRNAALAACAIAVLGAVSTAAAILPSSHAAADTQGHCVDTSVQPKPVVKATRHGPVVRGTTHGHRSATAAARAASIAAQTAAATASASATPSATATPSPSTSDDTSTPTPTSTSTPSAAPTSSGNVVTTIVGSLTNAISDLLGGQSLSLATGVYTFNNFSSTNVGAYMKGGLVGQGESKTVLEMTPNSSTRGGSVPTASGTTNPFSLMKVESGSPVLKDFTLQGTSQGHLYNGLQIKGTTGASITNVRVNAIPGSDKVNPGETFGINDFHTSGSVYSGVEVDGAGVGASAIGFNSSSNPTVKDSYFHDNPYSAGLALWQTQNATITDVISSDNRTGLNLERTSGTINVVRPTFKNNSAQDIYIGSDQSSVTLNIVDPVFTGKLRIRIPTNYWAGTQQQKRSDVHVIINGVDKTDSVVQWL